MTDAAHWRAKVAQMFHDPVVKAFCQGETAKTIARNFGGEQLQPDEEWPEQWDGYAQNVVGAFLSKRLFGDGFVLPVNKIGWVHWSKLAESLDADILPAPLSADLAASGADRPNLGNMHKVRVALWKPGADHIEVTHPLAAAPLQVPTPASQLDLLAELRPAFELLDDYRKLLPAGDERFKLAWYLLWRHQPAELAGKNGVFWSLQPADTRCPDHSIWDHLRVTSSLAFIPATGTADESLRAGNPDRRPWLLSLWVGPARDFVGQARTARDLWTGSMMLSELAWALIEPIVEAYGADAVLYPDLRSNPRADRWIVEQTDFGDKVLDGTFARSYAALVPNRLVALVPEGNVRALADACLASARASWRGMAGSVRDYLGKKTAGSAWQSIFDDQVKHGPALRWSAVRWEWDGAPSVKQSDLHLDPAIPFQPDAKGLPKPIRKLEKKRAERFSGWLPDDVWLHYQAARQTSLMTHAKYLLMQRGFDYPLAHHQLLALDSARARLGSSPGRSEPGEKCTLCGARQVLSNEPDGTVGQQRNAARRFWAELTDEGDGAERLCGVCAVRRFLSDTGNPIAHNWQGAGATRRGGGRHAEPFPSTGLIAGQLWVEKVGRAYVGGDASCRAAVRDVVAACEAVETARRDILTQFGDSLARTRRLLRLADRELRRFLAIDIQYLDPNRWDALVRQEKVDSAKGAAAKRACETLRRATGRPITRLAVIMLDGDRMGRLLLGDPDAVVARWKDVLHPQAVALLRSGQDPWKRFWRTTMERPRLMGPSTHAFVSRALREFSNRILPWVAEREHGARLIYAGGDEALLLCPADQALPLLARLHTLYTSAWVLDSRPDASAWPDDEPPDDPVYEVGEAAKARFKAITDVGGQFEKAHQIVPMLGENQSFSAGVAFGQRKTSLRLLRAAAVEAMADAKASGGRRVGLSWFTSSGVKLRWTASLSAESGGVEERRERGGIAALKAFAKSFGERSLPGRLPYKLRERLPAAVAVVRAQGLDEDERTAMIRELVLDALDGASTHAGLIANHWLEALRQLGSDENRTAEKSLDGLLLARALAGSGDS